MHFTLLIVVLICLNGFAYSKSNSPFNPDSKGVDVPNVSIIGGTAAPTLANFLLCHAQSEVSAFTVFVNTLSINGGGPGSATRGVSKFIVHQLFNINTYDNDIALIVLSSPVTNVTPVTFPVDSPVISSTVRPTSSKPTPTKPTTTTSKTTTPKPPTTMKTTTGKITTITGKPCSCSTTLFPPPNSASPVLMRAFSTYANSVAVIAGWGTGSGTSEGGFSNVLLKANVIIHDNSICTAQYGPSFIGADMMCASGPSGKGYCQGDDGGPIFVNGVQVGIISYTYSCNVPNYAGVYTRLSTYLGWIATTKVNNPPPTVG